MSCSAEPGARRTLEARAVRLEQEREEAARAAVAEERRRIARDLHDVVAHSVSVMTVQAGAARLLLAEGEPARAREPLLSVEATGRQALTELRCLLGLLRAGKGRERALSPRPGPPRCRSSSRRRARPVCRSSSPWRESRRAPSRRASSLPPTGSCRRR